MPSKDRKAAARRRAWGRGPMILRFEPLEGRQLLAASATNPLPDLVATTFDTGHNVDWGDSFHAQGIILNKGDAPTTVPVTVGIFASVVNTIGPSSIPIGTVTIPAGLAQGASFGFDEVVSLPLIPIPGVGAETQNSLWVGLRVDTTQSQPESDRFNNEGRGRGLDSSIVTITPAAPSNLVGTSLAVTPNSATWGSKVYLTAQVRNNAQGDAPMTRARLVLTPAGLIPGSPADVTIGSFPVPAIPAWQTANITQSVDLPAGPPASLTGATTFVLSMVQDADYVTNPVNNHAAAIGLGSDQAVLNIAPNPSGSVAPTAFPDLAPSAVVVPNNTTVLWGTTFQVATTIENLGQIDAPAFRVRFLLTGTNGATDQAIFLGDALVPGLKAGYSQNVAQTLKLPSRVPYGTNLSSLAYGRIVAVIDPESSMDETIRSNNSAASAPIILKVFGSDGTTPVPTGPPISYSPTAATPTATPPPTAVSSTPKKTRAEKIAAFKAAKQEKEARVVARRPHYSKLPPKKPAQNPIIHQIINYPKKITKAFQDITRI